MLAQPRAKARFLAGRSNARPFTRDNLQRHRHHQRDHQGAGIPWRIVAEVVDQPERGRGDDPSKGVGSHQQAHHAALPLGRRGATGERARGRERQAVAHHQRAHQYDRDIGLAQDRLQQHRSGEDDEAALRQLEESADPVPGNDATAAAESLFRKTDAWSLMDDEQLLTKPAASDYGIEKLSASEFLAPESDAADEGEEPFMTLELVSLEEADDEAADSGAVEVPGTEDEVEADEDDTFLAEEEEEDEEDVGDIIGDVDEEEP